MWAVLSFVIKVAIGLVVVLAVGRRGSAQSNSYPWNSTPSDDPKRA